MNYPLISEYIESIRLAEDSFEELKDLRPVLDEDGQPIMSSGNFAVVFKMKDEQTGKLHAVKCFLKEQEGRADAYRMIAEELEYVNSTFLTPIRYLDKELFVDSKNSEETEFPVLLMDWVEGMTLDKYIREHIDDQYELSLLAYQFSRLAMWLMPQPFAHGDLKPDNILVKEDGALVLVDYDGMFVPAMKGQNARELGSPDFRHPSRTENDFDEHIDDFSLASILLSLKAISLQPGLLEEYGASDRLIFSEKDYRDISQCEVLKVLYPSKDSELNILLSLFTLVSEKMDLSNVSFRLLNLNRPKESDYDNLNTEVTEEDLANAWEDEYGVKYSSDGKRLLKAPSNIINYHVLDGTKIICKKAFYNAEYTCQWDYYFDREGDIIEYNGSKLESITLPSSLKVIGDSAFYNCKYLTSVIIHGVAVIGKYVFSECRSLESINLPKGVREIGESTFSCCIKLHSILIPCGIKIIEDNLFFRCDKLTYVTIPESVKIIKKSSFKNCRSIVSIIIPNSVIEIGDSAFEGCSKIETIYFSQNLATIGQSTFRRCISLKSIYIPANIKQIGRNAFFECTSLNSIIVDNENSYYDSRNFCNAIIDTVKHTLIVGCSSTKIPKGIQNIGSYSFYSQKGLTNVEIPDGVKTIGACAFSGCLGISSIVIPESMIMINDSAFFGCDGLETITLANSDTNLGKNVFNGCGNLKDIIIAGEDVDRFLMYDYGLKYAERGVQGISLFPNSTKVDEKDFENVWVDEYGVIYSSDKRRLLKSPKNLIDYTIKEGTKLICDYSFYNCINLSTIIIPDSVLKIGMGVFQECQSLQKIIIPNSVKEIQSYSFKGCCNLSSIRLPDSLVYVGYGMFRNCTNLYSLEIPINVKRILEGAFSGCNNLINIIIPENVQEIGDNAFDGCTNIKQITIPKNVSRIGNFAFANCESLSSIIFSDGIIHLGGGLFQGCKSLKSVYLPNSVSSLSGGVDDVSWNTFYECDAIESIFIPKGEMSKFQKLLLNYKDKLVEQI